MSDIDNVIMLAKENALINKALYDISIVLLSNSEKSPIISGYDNELLSIIFKELYKLKGWTFVDHENSKA